MFREAFESPDYLGTIGEKAKAAFSGLKDLDLEVLWFFCEHPRSSAYDVSSTIGPLKGKRIATAYETVQGLQNRGYLRFQGSRPSKRNSAATVSLYEPTQKGIAAAMGIWAVNFEALRSAPKSNLLRVIHEQEKDFGGPVLGWIFFFLDKLGYLGIDLGRYRLDNPVAWAGLMSLALSVDPEETKATADKLGFKVPDDFFEVFNGLERIWSRMIPESMSCGEVPAVKTRNV